MRFCTRFLKSFILKILVCTIMSGFRKLGHIYCGLHVTSGGEDVTETVHFITMMDKFLDCLNVRGMSCRKKKRKPFQDSYRKKKIFA